MQKVTYGSCQERRFIRRPGSQVSQLNQKPVAGGGAVGICVGFTGALHGAPFLSPEVGPRALYEGAREKVSLCMCVCVASCIKKRGA